MNRRETTGFKVPIKEEQQKTNLQLQVDSIQLLMESIEQRIRCLEDAMDSDYSTEDSMEDSIRPYKIQKK